MASEQLCNLGFKKQEAFEVYLRGRKIDTVFATSYTVEEMRVSLINHDGYNSGIVVRKATR